MRSKYLEDSTIKSIYFGGGTPSILNKEELIRIFEQLRKKYFFDIDKTEITLEANPDDLTIEKLTMLKSIGINRLSIGIQSFDENDLTFMNRSHTAKQALDCIHDSQNIGFDNISIDLIFGLPNSTHESWQKNLEIATQFNVPHLSIYNLTVEPNTGLFHLVKHNKIEVANDIKASNQFYQAKKHLAIKGYKHYEISNYCKDNLLAKHNTSYWKGNEYIGFGPGAHSYNGTERQWNVSNNNIYIKSIKKGLIPSQNEILSNTDIYNEYILTGLRTIWGCHINVIEKMNNIYAIYFKNQVQKHIKNKNIIFSNGYYILSESGLIYTDSISADLMYLD